jgi:hypothetical protein
MEGPSKIGANGSSWLSNAVFWAFATDLLPPRRAEARGSAKPGRLYAIVNKRSGNAALPSAEIVRNGIARSWLGDG